MRPCCTSRTRSLSQKGTSRKRHEDDSESYSQRIDAVSIRIIGVTMEHCSCRVRARNVAGLGFGKHRTAPTPIEFFVSPQGDDSWSGRLPTPRDKDGPFATIERRARCRAGVATHAFATATGSSSAARRNLLSSNGRWSSARRIRARREHLWSMPRPRARKWF